MLERKNHTEFAHVKAHEDCLWYGVADLLAKGERNTDHYTTARNSTQRSSHLRPQPTLRTCSRDTRANDSDAFVCDVFDLNHEDDAITNLDRARPHHIVDGLPVICWRHFLQAKSKLNPGRAVGTEHRWFECRSRAVLEHERNFVVVVHP